MRDERVGVGLVVAAGVAPLLRSLANGFAYDDTHSVLHHPGVRGPFSPAAIFGRDWWGVPLGRPDGLGSYRPFATLTLWLDAHVGGGAAWPFHLTNLLLYAGILLMAWVLLRRFAGEAMSATARLLAIALFATLAIHVEVVANATGRAELLATLASLGALHLALGELGVMRTILIGLLLVIALGSKESAYPVTVLAPVLAFRARGEGARGRGAAAWVAVPSAIVLAFAVALRATVLQFGRKDAQMVIDNPLVFAPFRERVFGAMDVFPRYLGHAASGVDLCPDYGYAHHLPARSLDGGSALGFVMVAALVAALVLTWRRAPRVADALLGFGAAYAVISHLFIGASVLLADRVFFFPSFWMVVVVVLAGQRLSERRPRLGPLLVGAAALFAATQAVLSFVTVPVWRDDRSLADYAVRACPRVMRSWILRLDVAQRANEAEEGAWAALAASALYLQHPRPVADDLLPETLADQPYPARVAHLRARLGDDAFARARTQAQALLVNKRFTAAAGLLAAR
ncbi:MAG: hypothetical protein HYV09_27415 [Deltaproteobacteria bacterium]|nr:hypothetical protein [Deltaproteobacteria bacterium]